MQYPKNFECTGLFVIAQYGTSTEGLPIASLKVYLETRTHRKWMRVKLVARQLNGNPLEAAYRTACKKCSAANY